MATSSPETRPNLEASKLTKERPPVQADLDGGFTFTYRERNYEASFANPGDIVTILRGVRESVEAEDNEVAERLSAEVREDPEKALKVGAEAGDMNRKTEQVLGTDYIKVESFLYNLIGGQNVLDRGHNGLLKLTNESATELIFNRYKGTFKNEKLVGTADNKPNVMFEGCFILSQKDGDKLKELLHNLNSSRFYIIEGSTENQAEDSFIVYMNGLEVPFLCPKANDYQVTQEAANDNEEDEEEIKKAA